MTDLTEREHQVLRFYPPTMSEIRKALGWASTSTVHRYVWSLKAKGRLDVEPGSPRAMRVVGS